MQDSNIAHSSIHSHMRTRSGALAGPPTPEQRFHLSRHTEGRRGRKKSKRLAAEDKESMRAASHTHPRASAHSHANNLITDPNMDTNSNANGHPNSNANANSNGESQSQSQSQSQGHTQDHVAGQGQGHGQSQPSARARASARIAKRKMDKGEVSNAFHITAKEPHADALATKHPISYSPEQVGAMRPDEPKRRKGCIKKGAKGTHTRPSG